MAQTKKSVSKPDKTGKKPASRFSVAYFWNQFKMWWHTRWWHKLIILLCAVVIFCIGSMYGIAQWYIAKHSREPTRLSATFISDYAEYFGLDPHDTLHAILTDLGVHDLRLVSYWSNIEKNQGNYDFSDLDWQFAMANQYHAKVSLTLGLRQPRWPECHMPTWAMEEPKTEWEPQLKTFITAVVERYKDNPALDSYQLE
ncbi:MAG TPA: hypothetical protein VLF87_01270, partial [Patescibacteria group bacterium]|nr:hypothetical protein [Patescibacteria group bacterium]